VLRAKCEESVPKNVAQWNLFQKLIEVKQNEINDVKAAEEEEKAQERQKQLEIEAAQSPKKRKKKGEAEAAARNR
jgi:hypothetical protein